VKCEWLARYDFPPLSNATGKNCKQLVNTNGLRALIGKRDFLTREDVFPMQRSGTRKLDSNVSPAKLCIIGSSLLGA